MRGVEFLTCIWAEQQVALAASLVTAEWRLWEEASGAGRGQWCGQRPVAQPVPPSVPSSWVNQGNWTCWNAKDVKGMPCTVYGVFCLTIFSSVHDFKF